MKHVIFKDIIPIFGIDLHTIPIDIQDQSQDLMSNNGFDGWSSFLS